MASILSFMWFGTKPIAEIDTWLETTPLSRAAAIKRFKPDPSVEEERVEIQLTDCPTASPLTLTLARDPDNQGRCSLHLDDVLEEQLLEVREGKLSPKRLVLAYVVGQQLGLSVVEVQGKKNAEATRQSVFQHLPHDQARAEAETFLQDMGVVSLMQKLFKGSAAPQAVYF